MPDETDETLDLTEFVRSFGGDALDDEMRQLLVTILADLVPTVEQLRAALEAADPSAARYAAHAAKGVALAMGAKSLAALCTVIDQSLKIGELAAAQARAGELRPQLDILARRVQALS